MNAEPLIGAVAKGAGCVSRGGPRLARGQRAAEAEVEAARDSFMEVGTDEQFEYLRAWQAKVYAAGYLGMSWPSAYGGGGGTRRISTSSTRR